MRELSAVEQQWLFKKSDLDRTPSRKAGISYDEELGRRRTTIEYIGSLGLRAGLGHAASGSSTAPEEVLSVAATMVHRFYMRRSFADFDEKLIAPTILFITSKTEEESLKLRYIVNACLDKWVPGGQQWVISEDKENYPPQSKEYQGWEKEILAAEEMILDALCFDLIVKNPWVHLHKSTADLTLAEGSQGSGALRRVLLETSKALLIDGNLAPLGILYDPTIAALGAFTLALAIHRRVPIEEALAAAREMGTAFRVDVEFSEEGILGVDADLVKGYCDDYLEFGRLGLYDVSPFDSLPVPSNPSRPYTRIFKNQRPKAGQVSGSGNGEGRADDMAKNGD